MNRYERKRTFEIIVNSQKVKSECHTIIFYNKGSNPFIVFGIEVLPNTQQMFYGQFECETDVTLYEVIFPNNFDTANNSCQIIREYLSPTNN